MTENSEDLDRKAGHDEIDRGMPSINQRGKVRSGIGQKIIVGGAGLLVVLALVAVNGGFSSGGDKKARAAESNDEIGNRLGPAPELPPPPPPPQEPKKEPEQPEIIRMAEVSPPPPPPPPRYPTNNQDPEKQPPTPNERKTASPLLAFGSVSRSGDSRQPMTVEERSQQMTLEQGQGGVMMGGRADGLGANLAPTKVDGARASLIADRNMFITKGMFLGCALETAISSDVPGMTSCRITRDVYSTSGKVLLLERGSRIVGQYQGGLRRGQARIFVLWTRAETPNGVVVNLDSPGTDALGRSGHSGYIDTHFWERFGGAIMLSLIDDVGAWVANESSSSDSGNNQIQFGSTTEAAQNSAGIALENSINIPPTLIKHQGDNINIFVARDLDFRGVYDLRAE